MPKIAWWKWVSLLLLLYVVIAGFLGPVPRLHIVNESIRNTYFHVPMWFGMIFLLGASVWQSVLYLRTGSDDADLKSASAVQVGVLFGVLGLITGMLWANFTWGEAWSNDPKQNASAIGLLIYFGYGILRASLPEARERARISAVYSIFAFAVFIPLIWILPRFTDSLHPGNGGNPAFGKYDMNNEMRLVFYPAVIGWTLLGFWLSDLWYRAGKIRIQWNENEK
jgi:heme exporter protein C